MAKVAIPPRGVLHTDFPIPFAQGSYSFPWPLLLPSVAGLTGTALVLQVAASAWYSVCAPGPLGWQSFESLELLGGGISLGSPFLFVSNQDLDVT